MKRRISVIVLACVLALTALPFSVFGEPGFANFSAVNAYHGQFADVPSSAWYAESVASAYRLGLIAGTGEGRFNPEGNLKLCEVIALACSLHSKYYEQAVPETSASPWYQRFVDYAVANGIIAATDFLDYERAATRAECVMILANCLPKECFAEINEVPNGAIPDVPVAARYANAVYRFYRAGIMGGYENGEFRPANYIRRCEVAATLLRVADPNIRGAVNLDVDATLNAEQIAKKCADAVFYIEVYDRNGYAFGSGSGFFLESSGLAVTNYHVISGASSARVWLANGKVCDVEGVYDYSAERDIALLQIEGSGFATLSAGDSGAIAAGQKVFAIGSPKGLSNTISEGLISNVSRTLGDGQTYIQISAPISHGSSGGALLNAKGDAIGITSATIEDAQNLNFAIPISAIDMLSRKNLYALASVSGVDSAHTGSAVYALDPGYRSLTLASESGFNLYVYADGPFETLRYSISDSTMLSCSWGEWDEDTIPLSIETYAAGNAVITLTLLDETDSVIMSAEIPISIVPRQYNNVFALSNTELDLQLGDQTSVVVAGTPDAGRFIAHWRNNNPDVVFCHWGVWEGVNIPLYITADAPGNASITVDLMGDGHYLGSRTISVTVGNGPQVAFDYLARYAMVNGTYYPSDQAYFCWIGGDKGQIETEYHLVYHYAKDELALVKNTKASGVERMDTLIIPFGAPDTFLLQLQCDVAPISYAAKASVDPWSYRYEEPIAFASYTGPAYLREQDASLAGNELSQMLVVLYDNVLSASGYSLNDLGFWAFAY